MYDILTQVAALEHCITQIYGAPLYLFWERDRGTTVAILPTIAVADEGRTAFMPGRL